MAAYKGIRNIEPVAIYFRDPKELVSELFVNPEIMFKYKEHVLLNYFKDCKETETSECYSNLMSKRYASSPFHFSNLPFINLKIGKDAQGEEVEKC